MRLFSISHQHQYDVLFEDFQRTTFDAILLFIALSVWIWIAISATFQTQLPHSSLVLSLATEGVCGLAFMLRKRHFRIVAFGIILALWFINIWAILRLEVAALLYFFSLLTFICILVNGTTAGGLITFASLLFVFWYEDNLWLAIPPVVVMIAIFFTTFISFRILRENMNSIWYSQQNALQQMGEARDRRGELVEITKALNEAQQRLEKANIQLLHARRAADHARQLKAQFAANVSHELRTPINLIVGFSDMILNSSNIYGVPLPSPYWADMSVIQRNAKHLQGLITDVLDVSQIEAGQMMIVRKEVDTRQVILEAIDLVTDLIKSRGLKMEVDIPQALPILSLDRLRLRQILINLASNAVRFTDTGKIRFSVEVTSEALLIAVSDTGIGIRPEDHERIFEEFYQTPDSSRRQGGSGLGLTLTQRFVELHGGRVWVESTGIPSEGSTFFISLPLDYSHSPYWTGQLNTPLHPINRKRSLVVFDKDPHMLQLFERYASTHQVMGVEDVDEALRLIETLEPGALIVDVNAPEAERLENALRGSTPLITCSMPSGRQALQQLGATDYLVKPVTDKALLDALARLGVQVQTILIVDDDPDLVRLFSRILLNAPASYQILKAYSGEEGLALMRELCPDAVLLDITMPRMSGFGVIERMKADPQLAHIPIIIASAHGTFDAVTEISDGPLKIQRRDGFQPLELIRCIEALITALQPQNASP